MLFFLIGLNIIFISWRALQGNIIFHTDVARDFLVLHEMVETHKPTLIGPRAGGIPGVFHGPLWFYVNLPIFLLSAGNPVATAWFWVFLSLCSLGIVYYVGKRIFNSDTALFASLLYSSLLISLSSVFTNSFGAVLCFPLFFYFLLKYKRTLRIMYLLIALFTLGIIIQFQVGFGVLMLLLSTFYLTLLLIKRKKYVHFLAFFILVIPLSTFIMFEVRHDFLQFHSAIQYITTKASSKAPGEINLLQVPLYRLKGMLFEGFGLTSTIWLTIPVTAVFIWMFLKLKEKDLKYKDVYQLFFFFYIGFWFLTLFYKGIVWGFFYFSFLPVVVLIFVSFKAHLNRYIFLCIFAYVLLLNMIFGIQNVLNPALGWQVYAQQAREIYKDAGNSSFGYYVYSPDQYGYSGRYAMLYVGKTMSNKVAKPFQKDTLTYLLIAPPPDDKPWLHGAWWRENKVKIKGRANKTIQYPFGFSTEKYILSESEKSIPSDPTLIQDLTFR